MVSWIWIAVAVIAVLIIAGALWVAWAKRRSAHLKRRFGPEYDRAVRQRGRSQAEAELEQRVSRVEALEIRALTAEERDRFSEAWRAQQARFVDDPSVAVLEADRLVQEVMAARGYPVGDFEQRAADVSVEHPRVVENYRAAHNIAIRHQRAEANTEELRQAMVYYRALFEELLGTRVRVAGRETEIH